jgi:hypothetical protein
MKNDQLGRISIRHNIRADKNTEETLSEECIKLAKLVSDAVDFGKSGTLVSCHD